MTVLVDAESVAVARSDRVLFADLSLTVSDGDRVGVVGINGTGKSTLLRVLAGTEQPEGGKVRLGRGVRIGVLDQDALLPPGRVEEVVGGGWEGRAILDRLGMSPVAARPVGELSGGQAKRVALARVLAAPAELLVLDEPTNHLDLAAISWLEAWLCRHAGGLVIVSHDRHLLDRVTTRMVELDRGRSFVHDGGYAAYLDSRAQREERAATAETVRRNLARRELAWLRRGAPARSRKPQARVGAARRLVEGRPEAPARSAALDLSFGAPRLGSKVIELEAVSCRRDASGPPVLSGVTLALDPQERLAVVGANGSGKSTLLQVMAGLLEPESGRIEVGPTVRVGYYQQEGAELDPSARVRDLVAGPGRVPGDPADGRLMERFWFTGELPWATVGTLSGGERRRLQLLMVLAGRPNVLLLDEPTNDLDLDTLRALEGFLEEWPGALVAVSHDRIFLDRVTERAVVCSEGTVAPVRGGLAAWIAEAVAQPAGALSPDGTSRSEPVPPMGGREAAAGRRRALPGVGAELRRLDKELERLSRDRDRLAIAFEEASRGDHRELGRLGEELTLAQTKLDETEERWLDLAERAEG